ncbi:MAG: magnetochrome domain-containing protein [Candidatus Omnitrophica bacterium]|nr:magnetochrome domain-containing protein [Candidatus Omnitrophota bacterium]
MARDKNDGESNPRIEISVDEFKSRLMGVDLNTIFIWGAILLVLVITVFALMTPDAQKARASNPACGKIVVAADGSSLKSNVAQSLSAAKYFLVVDPLKARLLESAKNPYSAAAGTGPEMAYFVAGKGEEAVIAGTIEPPYYQILNQFGIRGFGGYAGRVKDAVDLYRQARISAGPGRLAPTNATPVAMDLQRFSMNVPDQAQAQGPVPYAPAVADLNTPTNPFLWGWPDFVADMTGINQAGPGQVPGAPQRPEPAEWWRPEAGWVNAGQGAPMGQPMGQPMNQSISICPSCGWRIPCMAGQAYPRCPNCGVISRPGMGMGPVAGAGMNGWRQNAPMQPVAFGHPGAAPAPVIARNAQMPHTYRGVCVNCHQIVDTLPGTTNQATPVAFTRGTCVIR